MQVVDHLSKLREARATLADPLGLVPTMGFLHEGHLSLVRRAREECASVGVSIFVNPAQFGPSEDLETYPVDLGRDLSLLEEENADLIWTPSAEEMYGTGYQTWVEVKELSRYLEGKVREGHLKGVATIVAKLFNCYQPQRAYFGQKDAQQAAVIRRMAEDLNFPVEIVVCPTVREPDGLAMSSRNSYLSADERQAATVLYRALSEAGARFESGERDAAHLKETMESVLASEPLARPEYASVADPDSLKELDGHTEHALLSMAVHVGSTRLIDNMVVGDK